MLEPWVEKILDFTANAFIAVFCLSVLVAIVIGIIILIVIIVNAIREAINDDEE